MNDGSGINNDGSSDSTASSEKNGELMDSSETPARNSGRPKSDQLHAFVSEREIPEDNTDKTEELILEQEFFIPVHEFIRLTRDEVAVVNHPAFQRLGNVCQLGQSHLVYRGATHKRFEHALGTLQVAEEIIQAIRSNHKRLRRTTDDNNALKNLDEPPTERERAFIRLAALIHDIGHIPAGHTLEDELGVLEKHDQVKRLNLVLRRTDWPGGNTSPLEDVINKRYAGLISDENTSPCEVILQIVSKDKQVNDKSHNIRVNVCRDIVGNTICADLLDYLHRDWYHIGKPQHFDRRIFQYMQIRYDTNNKPTFVISLGTPPKVRTDAVSEIIKLLESRYSLSESVIFHRTKCSAAAMLERAMQEIWMQEHDEEWKDDLVKDLFDQSDASLIEYLLNETESEAAAVPLRSLQQRRLYKNFYTKYWDDFLTSTVRDDVRETYSEADNAPQNRNSAARALEDDFGLQSGSIAIYCPDKAMNHKIASVNIHLDGDIAPLNEVEQDDTNGTSLERELSAGHLDAQIERFTRLWRVHVFVHRSVLRNMSHKLRDRLRKWIHLVVFNNAQAQGTDAQIPIPKLAKDIATIDGHPYSGKTIQRKEEARDYTEYEVDTRSQYRYPIGTPRLSVFFSE